MKLTTYERGGLSYFGLVDGDGVIELGSDDGLKRAIASDSLGALAAQADRGRRVPLAEVRFLPVIPQPGKILAIGLNYEDHRLETGRPVSSYPSVFVRFPDSQIGHEAPILLPPESTCLDYEGELAVIIGRGGRRISQHDAMAHVAGYACYNDGTIRDWQRHTHQFTPGKTFPGTGGFGPFLVTADEIEDYRTLSLKTRVNGKVVQAASLSELIFSIPHLIEYLSAFTPLSPGDVILTGTPGGVGFKKEPPQYLVQGDVVEVEIDRVGTLRNRVEAEG